MYYHSYLLFTMKTKINKLLEKLGILLVNVTLHGSYYEKDDVIIMNANEENELIVTECNEGKYEMISTSYYSHIPFILKYHNYFAI